MGPGTQIRCFMRRGPGPLSNGLGSHTEHLGPGLQIKIYHDDEEGHGPLPLLNMYQQNIIIIIIFIILGLGPQNKLLYERARASVKWSEFSY